MNAMERAVNRPILCPKIIGRIPEFAALGLLVEQAKGGQGHIALIAGEAGIGKSRLVSELKALAVVEGFLVVQGACFPTDLTYPYAPLLDLLRSLVASNPKASLTAAVETLARDIFPLLPELVPDQTTPLSRLEPEQEKHRLFAVLATFFLYLSTQSPVLLIIEDVHWSDDTSLDFLHYLTRRSASQPLLLLVTYRHEEIQPELSSWLAQLDRERLAHEIRLVPLARNEVDTMLSAIYSQLLTRERRMLHRTIAETMEQQPPVTPDLHLEDLAYHFYQARDWQKAVDYAQRAGEKALGLYSHRAAIDYFTWALEAANHLSLPSTPTLYRARGQAYETLGEFEQAQHDYIQALDAARKMNNRAAEWQSAIDLGFLWAGRDYAQAETWFRQALILSQALDDPALHARSLNRIGNWHLNVEQPHEALRYHRKALAIFQQLNDARGIAETLDLLGMTSYLGGDLIGGTAYYQQAIALFDELGNREGLTSSLATLTIRASTYHTDALIAVTSLAEVLPDAERAVKVAREIGQRSAESYALLQLGLCLGSQGEYTHALAACQQSLHIAEEIEHRQWQTAAHVMLGGVYDGLLAHRQASDHFEQALVLAEEMHSLFWTRMATGYLASVSILLHDYARAEALLHTALSPDTAIQTMAQRMLCCASVELALAQGHPTRAIEIIDQLVASAAQVAEGQSSLRVLKLRGEALAALQRPAEAEAALTAAQALAVMLGARPRQWQICIALGNLYQTQERNTEAEQAFVTARTLIEELAATITDESLRDNFLQRATAMLPHTPLPSPSHSAKQAFGGLTAREREIAALIAHGKFNREIADVLVLSERTIETHVSNIKFKLSFTSRIQIASWAIERGLR